MKEVCMFNSDLDLITALRLQSILGGPQQVPDQMPNVQQPPQATANSIFMNHLQNMPQRPVPSTMNKIRGKVSYFGSSSPNGMWGGNPVGFHINSRDAAESEDNAMYGNFNNSMQDWVNKAKPLEYAANQGRLNDQIAINQQKADEQERHNKEVEGDRKNRTEAYVFKIQHPDWKAVVKSGSVVFVNPKDPTQTVDTGIDSGKLSDIDKMNLGLTNKLTEIKAQTEGQKEIIPLRGEQERQNIELRGDQKQQNNWSLFNTKDENGNDVTVRVNSITGEVQPVRSGTIHKPSTPGSGGGEESERQKAVGVQNRLKQSLAEHPEWSKYIVSDGKDYGLKMPSGFLGMGGGDDKVYHEIYNKIYGSSSSAISPTSTPETKAQPVESTKGAAIAEKRRKAIQILQQNKQLVTDANINHVMEQMK